MSPTDDTFISGGLDNSVRLWDLRTPSCNGLMQVTGKPVCAFDPEGLIFSVGVNSEQVFNNESMKYFSTESDFYFLGKIVRSPVF